MYNHQLTIHSHNFHKHSCHIRSYSHHHNSSHRRQTYLTSPITRSKQLHHQQCYPQKHPRLRWKDWVFFKISSGRTGSPPLTRERQSTPIRRWHTIRITPAYAGKTVNSRCFSIVLILPLAIPSYFCFSLLIF